MKNNYYPTIGIECHVQLNTKTKLFSGILNDARDSKPNTLISHICYGMPGALPVLNKHAIELVARAAFALKTTPQKFSKFDRKHYFYPDLPKGYQISQFKYPLIIGGEVEIIVGGETKKIGVTRAHLEEDAGKNTHPDNKDYSLVDLNRAGTPLLEIVSEPDIHSAKEARAYVNELYYLMKYAKVTEGDLYHGNVRFDVNISVSSDPKKLGNRSEIKNLNSFKAVEKSVEYEIKRQSELLDQGIKINQETRGWNESKQKTFSQRTKEEAHDYRYFPDPDLPPVVLDDKFINKQKDIYATYNYDFIKHKLSQNNISPEDQTIIFNNGTKFVDFSLLIIDIKDYSNNTKKIIFDWLINVIPTLLADTSEIMKSSNHIDDLFLLAEAYEKGKLNSTSIKKALKTIFSDKKFSFKEFLDSQSMISDETETLEIIKSIIKENPKASDDVANGELKAIGFLVGQVMKKTNGKINPGLAKDMIKKELNVN